MKKTIALVCAMLALAACGPKPDGGDDAPFLPEEPKQGYAIRVSAVSNDPNDEFTVRQGVCTLEGYTVDQLPARWTDEQTGNESVYAIEVQILTPQWVRLVNRSTAAFVKYSCLIVGDVGDSIHCEVTNNGMSVAIDGAVDYDLIVKGDRSAICHGEIAVY